MNVPFEAASFFTLLFCGKNCDRLTACQDIAISRALPSTLSHCENGNESGLCERESVGSELSTETRKCKLLLASF